MLSKVYLFLGVAAIIGGLSWLVLHQTEKLGEAKVTIKGFEIAAKFVVKERKRYQDSLSKHAEDMSLLRTEIANVNQELNDDRDKARKWADTDRPDVADEWVCRFARCTNNSGKTGSGTSARRDGASNL